MDDATITAILVAGHFLLNIFFSIRIIYSNRSPGWVLAWLVFLFAVPYLGTIIYLFIGEPKTGRNRERRMKDILAFYNQFTDTINIPALSEQAQNTIPQRFLQIAKMGENYTNLNIGEGYTAELFDSTDSILDAFIKDIEAAQHSCLMMFYIVSVKGRVEHVMQAFMDAAARGVHCQLLVDALGSKEFLRSEWPDKLRQAGIKVSTSLPLGPIRALFVRSDLRNHRKMLIVDHDVAYTGSYNLVDPAFFKQNEGVGQWVDVVMRCQGPIAKLLASVFYADWAVEDQQNFDSTLSNIETLIHENADILAQHDAPGKAILQVIPSAPDQRYYLIYDTLVCALHGAEQSITITTPYFVPDETILTALTCAARRGVAVTLIVPEKNDSWLVCNASKAYYQSLLNAGANIMVFKGGLLHSKTVVIDGAYALFGTVNMDMRSFYLNMEVSLAVYDPPTIEAIAQLQAGYLQHASPVTLSHWQQRPMIQRFMENCVRLISPLL